jgi:hypothetical protein
MYGFKLAETPTLLRKPPEFCQDQQGAYLILVLFTVAMLELSEFHSKRSSPEGNLKINETDIQ